MGIVLVDTSAWIDYLRGLETPTAEWLDRALGRVALAHVRHFGMMRRG